MEVFTSKSAFPYGDFASEFAGAYVAGFFAHSVPPFKIGRFSLRPAIYYDFSQRVHFRFHFNRSGGDTDQRISVWYSSHGGSCWSRKCDYYTFSIFSCPQII